VSAPRMTTRVRGFAPWHPQAKTAEKLRAVRAVLAEYRDYLPMTNRQVYYRLIGRGVIDDRGRAASDSLDEILNRARRAGLISFDAIRDDGLVAYGVDYVSGPEKFIDRARRLIDDYALDPMEEQPRRILILCEAAGMTPMLAGVANPYGVDVLSSGGFDSTTIKYDLAMRLRGKPSLVFHIGDYDPSGVHLFTSLVEDVSGFLGDEGSVEFERLAVTPEQVARLSLTTQPKNPNDVRAFAGIDGDGVTACQAEAIQPDQLAAIVQTAIEAQIDRASMTRTRVKQQIDAATLRAEFPELWGENEP
jgi:hypothetical protein